MSISWLPPFTLEGVPLFFNITVIDASTEEIADFTTTGDENYVYVPRDLTTTYEVQITAWNAAGSSHEVSLNVSFTDGMHACVYGCFTR